MNNGYSMWTKFFGFLIYGVGGFFMLVAAIIYVFDIDTPTPTNQQVSFFNSKPNPIYKKAPKSMIICFWKKDKEIVKDWMIRNNENRSCHVKFREPGMVYKCIDDCGEKWERVEMNIAMNPNDEGWAGWTLTDGQWKTVVYVQDCAKHPMC